MSRFMDWLERQLTADLDRMDGAAALTTVRPSAYTVQLDDGTDTHYLGGIFVLPDGTFCATTGVRDATVGSLEDAEAFLYAEYEARS